MNHAVGRWLKVGVLTFVTAALVACAGAAGKPGAAGAPGAAAEVPPLPVGTIPDQALEVAGTKTVALGGYFSEGEGETLTYTAASSVATVATVSVSGSTLTITAVVVGSAVITVTATDEDSLTAKQAIKVTVTAAADPTDPTTPTTPTTPTDPTTPTTPTTPADPTTITISDKMKESVDLNDHLPAGAAAADYQLESRKKSVFTVAAKSISGVLSNSVWEVNPVSEGTAKAEIVGKVDGKVAATLTVTVKNRAPEPYSKAPALTLMMLSGPVPHARPAANTVPPLMNENNDYGLELYYINLPAQGQFEDPDADENAPGMLKYKITSSRDDVIVQDGDTCTTAKTTKCKVWVDIVARRDGVDAFNLNVVAEDTDMATSPSVSFPILMEYPAKQIYDVLQFKANGDFRAVTVGYRADTEHELVFKHPVEMDMRGFLFAEEYIKTLGEIQTLNTATNPGDVVDQADPDAPSGVPVTVGTPTNALYGKSKPADLLSNDGIADIIDTYTINTTGRVSVAGMTKERAAALTLVADDAAEGDDATLAFTVTGVGTGTIEIGYHVWWDEDGAASDPTVVPATGTKKAKWHSATRKLRVTVVAVD